MSKNVMRRIDKLEADRRDRRAYRAKVGDPLDRIMAKLDALRTRMQAHYAEHPEENPQPPTQEEKQEMTKRLAELRASIKDQADNDPYFKKWYRKVYGKSNQD